MTVFNVYDRQNVWYKQFQAFSSELVETDVHLMGRAFNAFVGPAVLSRPLPAARRGDDPSIVGAAVPLSVIPSVKR